MIMMSIYIYLGLSDIILMTSYSILPCLREKGNVEIINLYADLLTFQALKKDRNS